MSQRHWHHPSCCLRIYVFHQKTFFFLFFRQFLAHRELRAANVWAVMFQHCHNLSRYEKNCHAQQQCELTSRVKERTHFRRPPWHFSVSPHASYHGVKWVEQMSGFYNLYLVRERWFISNSMWLHIHTQELSSLDAISGAAGGLWIHKEHSKSSWEVFPHSDIPFQVRIWNVSKNLRNHTSHHREFEGQAQWLNSTTGAWLD